MKGHTHDEAGQLKLQMAVELEGGAILEDVARRYGLGTAYARRFAENLGVKVTTRRQARKLRLIAIIRECHSLEQPQTRIAALVGKLPSDISQINRWLGLKFSHTWGKHAKAVALPNKERAEVMAALYRDGYTLNEIGQQYDLTRERVRQILAKHKRMNADDGGAHVRTERLRAKRREAKEAACLQKHGCTLAQLAMLKKLSSRPPRARSPIGAFGQQRGNALRRGIGWELTLWQWWTIWQQSGHWEGRGRGNGYVMCRSGDVGPYAVGNVYIATGAQNSSDGQINRHRRKDPSLPIGVRREKSGRYLALRCINGERRRLGTHDTPELAYAAYLQATA